MPRAPSAPAHSVLRPGAHCQSRKRTGEGPAGQADAPSPPLLGLCVPEQTGPPVTSFLYVSRRTHQPMPADSCSGCECLATSGRGGSSQIAGWPAGWLQGERAQSGLRDSTVPVGLLWASRPVPCSGKPSLAVCPAAHSTTVHRRDRVKCRTNCAQVCLPLLPQTPQIG